jgi:hypothetical protein
MIAEIATTFARLDWIGWAKGLIAAFVGGGASSVSAGFGSMFTDPEHFNLGSSHGLRHLFTVMGITFLISGVVSLAAYLKQSPVPPPWDGQTERRQQPQPQPAQ